MLLQSPACPLALYHMTCHRAVLASIKRQYIARHTLSRMPSTVAVHAFTSTPHVSRCLTGETTMRIIVSLHLRLMCRPYLHPRHLHGRPCHSYPPTRSRLSRTPHATRGTSGRQRPDLHLTSPPTSTRHQQSRQRRSPYCRGQSCMQPEATWRPCTQAASHACAPVAHARTSSSYLFSLQDRSLSRQLPSNATSPAPCPIRTQPLWLPSDPFAVRPLRVRPSVLSRAACVRRPARPLPQRPTRQTWP